MFLWLFSFLNFFLAASVAHADPITAIGLVVSGVQAIASGASLVTVLLRAALGLGLSLLQQALNRQKNKQSTVGSVLEIKMGDDQPMTFPVGSRAVGGRRKYIGSWGKADGTPNAYLTDVIELSSLPSYAGPFGITSLWVGQQKCGVLWDQPHPDGRGYPVQQFLHPDGTAFMWIKYYDGTQTEADPFLVSKFGSHPDRPYGTDRIGRGCQYIILTTRLDNDLALGGSPPEVLVEPHPTPLYDPRKDSTNGGSGSHRYGDWTTYEPTLNPMVVAYNIVRGVYYTADEWVFGGQNVAAIRLPNSAWFAAMNECDRNGQYRCGLEIQCDQEPLDIIEDLRVACAGRLAEVGGMIKPLVGAPGAAVYAFDDTGIIITDEQDFEPFPSLTSTHNSISGTYPEPSQRWTVTDAPEARNLDQEAQDGQRSLPAPVRFDAVPFSDQVQHLMKTMAAEQRRFRIHTLTLPPSAYALEPNDVTSWSSARNIYGSKKFIVTAITGMAGMLQRVTLLEIDPTDYDPPTIYVPAPNGWIGPISAPSQPMTGWSVEPATIKDSGGIDRRPAIKISCAPDLEDVSGVWVQVRLKATGDLVFDSNSNSYADPYSWIISGQWMIANTDYEARGRYLPKSNRATSWSAWLTVKTPNVLIQAADVLDGAIIASKIADAAVTAAKIMDDAVSNLKLADQAVSTAKLEVAAVTADVLASGAVISAKLADGAVTAAKLAQGVVDATKLASSIKAVEVVSTLPTTGNVEGRQVFLTTDGKLYRYHNSAWTTAVASADINGTLTDAQIDAVAASKVTGQLTDDQIAAVAAAKVSGTLVSSQIADAAITNSKLAALAVDATKLADASITAAKIADAAVTTTKFASGIRPVEIVATLPTTGNVEGRMVYLTTDDKLYRYTGSAWTSATPSTDITGQMTDAQIAAVAAAKVTGTLVSSQIADAAVTNSKLAALAVDATKLADASVTAAKIADAAVSTTKFASGIRPVEIVATLPTTGNVEGRMVYLTTDDKLYRYTGAAWVSSVPSTDITGQLTDAQIAAVAAAKVTGQITSTQITDGAISTPKLAAGAVTANELAANSVVAAKIAAGAIVAAALSAGAVTTNAIAAGAVTATQIAANTITAGQISAGAIGATQIAANAVTTNAIAAGAVTANELAANAVTAGKIAANAVVATNIAAGAITADKMVLADFTNRVENPNFGEGDVSWIKQAGVTIVNDPANAYIGNWYMNVASGTGTGISRNDNIFPVVPGEQYFLQAFVKATGTPNSNMLCRIRYMTADKITSISQGSLIIPSTVGAAYTEFSNSMPVPANAVYAWVDIIINPTALTTGSYQVGFVSCQRKSAGSLIVDGAITAAKIAANAVTAASIAAGAIATDALAANAVTTAKIAAGAVTATQIAANTITAGQISAGAIGATQIAANAVTTNAIAAGAVTANELAANAVTAGKIAANAVVATNIAAGAVTARSLLLQDFENIVPNGRWEDTASAITSYFTAPSTGSISLITDPATALTGTSYMRLSKAAAGATSVSTQTGLIPVTAGESLYCETAWRSDVAATAGFYFRIQWYDSNKVGVTATPYTDVRSNVPMSTDWTIFSKIIPIPTGAAFCRAAFYNHSTQTMALYVDIDHVVVRRANAASLIVDGTITGTNIAATTITAANIAAGTLTAAQIAASAITATQLAAGAVTTAKLAAGAVTANELAASAVTAGKIAANAVTSGTIAANAVTAGTIAAGAVSASQIAAGAITTDKLASGSVTTDALAAGAVTATDIASNAVTADKIAANAVTAGKIAANAVTAGTIAAGAVTATTIAGGTITGDKLAANTIGADQIAANAITAKQLVLTDFSNMADNGWQTGTLDGWTTQNAQSFANDTTAGDAAGYVLQSLGRDCARSNFVAVTPGDVYAFDVWVKNTDANTAQVMAVIMTPTGSVSYPAVASTTTKNGWVRLQGRYTVASGYSKLAMLLQVNKTAGTGSSCYWSNPVMRRAVSAELIVDGAITANKMSVNSLDAITANLGAVNISSAVIGSLQVGTSNISGGAVTAMTAGRNAGGQTIGANATVNLAAAGVTVAGDGRVMINAMTIGQYNQNGNSQNAQPIGCNIFRDGTAIFSQTYYLGVVQTVVNYSGGQNGTTSQTTYTAGLIAVPALYDAPGAGYHVYTLQIYCPNNTIVWNESNIIATAFKR